MSSTPMYLVSSPMNQLSELPNLSLVWCLSTNSDFEGCSILLWFFGRFSPVGRTTSGTFLSFTNWSHKGIKNCYFLTYKYLQCFRSNFMHPAVILWLHDFPSIPSLPAPIAFRLHPCHPSFSHSLWINYVRMVVCLQYGFTCFLATL